jgi:hypothetical protein
LYSSSNSAVRSSAARPEQAKQGGNTDRAQRQNDDDVEQHPVRLRRVMLDQLSILHDIPSH